jgi:glutamine amidotransferase
MCEILALNFNQAVSPTFSFDNFMARSAFQPHGWGMAWYSGPEAQIIKSPGQASLSSTARWLQESEAVKSPIILSHLRYATHGAKQPQNTHPFDKQFSRKRWVFMHNGTLSAYKRGLRLKHFFPMGETDSEHTFCYLLDQLRIERKALGNVMPSYDFIESILQQINAYGRFNAVFSDSESLFVYRDEHGYNGLQFTQRQWPFSTLLFHDSQTRIDLSAHKNPDMQGIVIASKAQTDGENWQHFEPGRLAVFRNGQRSDR